MSTSIVSRKESIHDAATRLVTAEECELPVLPEVAAQLLKLTSDVNCEVAEIIALIKRDQSLTGHLLRIANSLRYNTGVAVSSIQQAVARLGLLCVREIVVLISCQCKVFCVPEFESEVRHSFRRSLTAAAFAQEIARTRRLNVEEAFLSGLLHDVGRPILLQALAPLRHQLEASAVAQTMSAVAEAYRIPLAARLIISWDLSVRIAEAVQYQQSPQNAPTCLLQAAVVNLAIDLATSALDPAQVSLETDEPHPMLGVLSLYPEQFSAIVRNRDKILEWVNSTT